MIAPCGEDWAGMDPSERGRFCARCDREVVDVTELSSSEAMAIVANADGPIPCVRARANARGDLQFRQPPCPGERPRTSVAVAIRAAAIATSVLTGCTQAQRYPEAYREEEFSSVARCQTARGEDWHRRSDPSMGRFRWSEEGWPALCEAHPAACVSAYERSPLDERPYSIDRNRLPAHLRAHCWDGCRDDPGETLCAGGLGIAYEGPPPITDWPDGPDVILAGLAADGVDWASAKQVAIRMLEPLGRCYGAYVDAAATSVVPQGRVRLLARIGPDGSVAGTEVEDFEGLPEHLVQCALRTLKEQRFGAPDEVLSTVEVDLRFVYRVLHPRADQQPPYAPR
jgi:hypothetical protein